jgi:hypothetical protein
MTTVREKTRWKSWADRLRQEMMTGMTAEVTKSVDTIISETATTKANTTLRSARFWKACQSGIGPNDFFAAAGFEIEYHQDKDQNVRDVTFKLNDTWMTILQRVLDRKKVTPAT